ncbi:putative protein [Arabidopsis thaliana]|nr:putative protein [Arabidopsis thaliana]CAB79252.1 putative protein [Arabidopsis thaliana]
MASSGDDLRLLSLIDVGDNVFSSFSDYLKPFSTLSTSRKKQDRATTIRALAKQFLPFLNKSISLLPKRLSVANSDKEARESALDLFRAYELCLDCLELVSAQLACKPHTVQSQRLRMIHCLDVWGLYENVYTEAFKVLEKLRGSDSKSRKSRLLPEVQDGDAEMALVVVDAVAAIFRAVAMSQQLDDKRYRKVLLLLEEVGGWLRVLDAKVYEKLHRAMVTSMGKCAVSLVREAERFNGDLVISFCDLTVKEHYKSALSKDRVYKDESNENLMEFFDLVDYCAHKFRAAGDMYCAKVSKKLNEMAAIFVEAIPQLNLVLRLYSTGLSITVCNSKLGEIKLEDSTDDWKIQAMFDDDARWQSLVSLLGMVDSYSGDEGNQTGSSSIDFIYSVKRKIVLETEMSCASAHLITIHDAFLQFCDGCLFLQRCTSDKGDREIANNKAFLNAAMGAFIVSLRTQLKLEISAHLVEDVIGSPWIQSQELKYLIATLYNIGIVLYRNKELNKSSSSDNDLSEDAIMDFVGEACNRCAFYLDILQKCSRRKIRQNIVHILENWLSAEHLIRRLPGPEAIVKQWVKQGELHHGPNEEGSPSSHMLPIAYCLRAFCTQEADPNSKKVFQDISTSLNLWLRILSLDDSGDSLPTENIIPLLYNMIDLMSVKGCTELHHHIYQLIFRLFKWKNVKLEVCLAMLWECRRLSHALCPSPISDAFIQTLSENCADKSTCIDFWMDCLKDSKAKLIGFQQNFHDLHNKDEGPFQSDITIDDIKDAASELISSASLSGNSSFAAAYLYYDLCERLISFGKLSEALSYAKEAYRIRTLIFQDKFKYTAEKHIEKHNEDGKISEIRTFSIKNFQVYRLLATDFWPCGNFLWDINRCYLSPWSVLQCYLESTLQVLFLFRISSLVGFHHFSVSQFGVKFAGFLIPFVNKLLDLCSSSLISQGNLYHKKQCLDLAEKELQNAKEILIANQRDFSCVKCKLKLEVTLDKQLGDISRKQIDRVSQTDGFLHAESLFSAALGKFCCSAWKSCIRSHGEEIAEEIVIDRNGGEGLGHNSSKTKLSIKEPPGNRGSRRGGRANKTCLSKDQDLISEPTSRLTRSMRHSLREQCQNRSNVPEVVSKKPNLCDRSVGSRGERVLLDTSNALPGFCICYKEKRQQCLSEEVTESGSLNNLVSRLLASLYLLSSSNSEFTFESDGNELSASHWVSFFHQASLGTHLSYHFISNLSQKHKSQCLSDKECTEATCSSCMVPEDLDLPRLAPDRTQDLVQFAKEFFINLPSSTIICISLLGGALNQLLQELMHIRSPVCAWVLISRLNPESQPVATLLPVDSIVEDMSDDSANLSSTEATQVKSLKGPWLCPWGTTVVDEVAPAFKSILEESHSSSSTTEEDTIESRGLWWKKRKKLNHRLGIFLRNLEASWLGPWRCLLLGEWSNYKLPDSAQKKLVNDLKSKCKMEVNEMLLKVILGGRGGYLYEEDSCKTPTAASNISESRHELALKLIHDAASKLGQQDGHENREPIILVLDPEVQMLPWENIPILRKQEVYRMPSVGCISAVLKKRSLQGEPAKSHVASFPLIDPLDSFYLLNPGGDLTDTQVTFESWFRDQNFEGKAGSEPSAIELTEALETHDLFLYFGHGSGGSPAIVATLWDVTDRDIDRFGKALLEAWLQERSDSSSEGGCSQCESLANDLAAMTLKGTKRSRKPSSRNKPAQSDVDGSGKIECNHKHRRKIGSFIAAARDACNLQYLIGAAPVCYGVPTGITRKKGIDALLPSSSR